MAGKGVDGFSVGKRDWRQWTSATAQGYSWMACGKDIQPALHGEESVMIPVLREYQVDCIERVRAEIRRGISRVMLQSPTGTGKTLQAAEMMRSATAKGKRSIFLVPRRELLRQASNKLTEFGVEHGIILAGEEPCFSHLAQVASVQTLASRVFRKKSWTLPQASLVIIDEAHISTANTWLKLIAAYTDIGATIIGLSATPARSDNRGLGHVYGALVCSIGVKEATEQGYLVPARYFAPTRPDLDGVAIKRGDYDAKQLGGVMDKPTLTGDIVSTWCRLASDRQTVLFATNVAHSRHLRDAFRAVGIAAEHIDGRTPVEERDEILNRFAEREVQVVCNAQLLIEGWDMPSCSCAVLAKPTKSTTRYLQQIGRVLRPVEGKTDCIAEGQLVLTDKGLVPIEKISIGMRVWDGNKFVAHGGAQYMGVKNVIEYAGLIATPDHKVLTKDGWASFGDCAYKQIPIVTTGFGGKAIRQREDYFSDHGMEGEEVEQKNVCALQVRHVWTRISYFIFQFVRRKDKRVSRVQSAGAYAEMAIQEIAGRAAKMLQFSQFILCKVWGERNRVPFLVGDGCVHVGTREHWDTSAFVFGQDQQRWPLRTGKYPLVNQQAEYFAHDSARHCTQDAQLQDEAPGSEVCGWDTQPIYSAGAFGRGNHRTMEAPVAQTQRRVWDILNAGPLHRFTVSGLLVHNCMILDHAGSVYEHGFHDEYIEWMLDSHSTVQDRQREKQRKEPAVVLCEQCFTVFRSQPNCPACNHVNARYGKRIDTEDGELGEVDRKRRAKDRTYSPADKRHWYAQFLGYARSKGYADGWAYHKTRAKCGSAPRDTRHIRAMEPGPECLAWIRHLNIKWAKRAA